MAPPGRGGRLREKKPNDCIIKGVTQRSFDVPRIIGGKGKHAKYDLLLIQHFMLQIHLPGMLKAFPLLLSLAEAPTAAGGRAEAIPDYLRPGSVGNARLLPGGFTSALGTGERRRRWHGYHFRVGPLPLSGKERRGQKGLLTAPKRSLGNQPKTSSFCLRENRKPLQKHPSPTPHTLHSTPLPQGRSTNGRNVVRRLESGSRWLLACAVFSVSGASI